MKLLLIDTESPTFPINLRHPISRYFSNLFVLDCGEWFTGKFNITQIVSIYS